MNEGKQLTLFLPNYGALSELPLIKQHLITADFIAREGIAEIQPGRDADIEKLLLFHSETYINALRTGTPDHLASSAFSWFPELYDISRSRLGSFLDAIDRAMESWEVVDIIHGRNVEAR
jgi:acetoin utilization deacetylase AcuC-like enzyme